MDQLQNVVHLEHPRSLATSLWIGNASTLSALHYPQKADIAKIPSTKSLKSRLAPFFLEDFSFFRSSSKRLYRAKVCRGRHELLGALS